MIHTELRKSLRERAEHDYVLWVAELRNTDPAELSFVRVEFQTMRPGRRVRVRRVDKPVAGYDLAYEIGEPIPRRPHSTGASK